jgi:hypothetical protein
VLLVSEAVGLYHNTVRIKQKRYRIMIDENIKYFQKSKGITQEELAVKLKGKAG